MVAQRASAASPRVQYVDAKTDTSRQEPDQMKAGIGNDDDSDESSLLRITRIAALCAVMGVSLAGAVSKWYYAVDLTPSAGLFWSTLAAATGVLTSLVFSRS